MTSDERAWKAALSKLRARLQAINCEGEYEGCFAFECATVSIREVLALLPGTSRIRELHEVPLCDDVGEVDTELASSVYACDAERCIVAVHDHWQAGLGGTITRYLSEDEYRRELARLEETFEAMKNDDT